jgi:1-acyl-sn-glycerol-3-phosphate acyltransferase
LSGQEFVDLYAADVKEGTAVAQPAARLPEAAAG